MRNLQKLFNPRSIAVIGASTDRKKVGSIIIKNLKESGYTGKIYPVNPHASRIQSLPAYASLTDIPDHVDQVTICIPAAGVLKAVHDCVQKGVSSIIIVSAGFGETGTDNLKLQDTITQVCREHDITLIGPNVIGVIHPATQLNNSWMQLPAIPGGIALISQSGALCCSILDVAADYDLRFSHFCSIGNKADIDELDLIEYFQTCDEVKVIALYLEDIKRGFDFLKNLRFHPTKPIIIYHSGKTASAASAALSHTGSMTSERDLVATAMHAGGVLEATTIHEFYLLMQAFSHTAAASLPEFGQYAIITNAGGPGIIATDELVSAGWQLAELADTTKNQLRAVLPPAASVSNPIDILGDALPDRYRDTLEIVGADPEAKIILVVLTPQHVTQPRQTAQAICKYAKAHPDKTILTVMLGDASVSDARRLLTDRGLLVFSEIRDAVRVGSFLLRRAHHLYDFHERIVKHNYRYLEERASGKYHALLDAVLDEQPGKIQILSDRLTSALMREVDISLPDSLVTTSLPEALAFARPHYPVVAKATNQTLAHKSDSGAVIAAIRDDDQLTDAFTKLQSQLTTPGTSSTHPPEILLQEMIEGSRLEFFIGAKRDGAYNVYEGGGRGFGHLITFGQGGIFTELHRDLARFVIPERRRDVKELLWETQLYPLIEGYRSCPALPEPAIIDAIMAVQKLVIAYPEIVALDINPLLVTPEKVTAVDVKIFISR